MKFPRHIILDINNVNITVENNYWINEYYLNVLNKDIETFESVQRINTWEPKSKTPANKIKSTVLFINDVHQLKRNQTIPLITKNYSNLAKIFDINYIKKEKIYTKLKYSRSPQYDIVSGGVAALLSAFVGFLISEKFGMELPDSGDFYFLFMYIVFLCFSLRPLVRILDVYNMGWNPFSLKYAYDFWYSCIYLILRLVVRFVKTIYKLFL